MHITEKQTENQTPPELHSSPTPSLGEGGVEGGGQRTQSPPSTTCNQIRRTVSVSIVLVGAETDKRAFSQGVHPAKWDFPAQE